MKKILSFAAIAAIVTGTFAFTSKKYSSNFCLSNTNGGTCVFKATQSVNVNGTQFWYDNTITPTVAADCNLATNCVTPIKLKDE